MVILFGYIIPVGNFLLVPARKVARIVILFVGLTKMSGSFIVAHEVVCLSSRTAPSLPVLIMIAKCHLHPVCDSIVT